MPDEKFQQREKYFHRPELDRKRFIISHYEIGGRKGDPHLEVTRIVDKEDNSEVHKVFDPIRRRSLGFMYFYLQQDSHQGGEKLIDRTPKVQFSFTKTPETIPLQHDIKTFGQLSMHNPVRLGVGDDGLYIAFRNRKGVLSHRTASIRLRELYSRKSLGYIMSGSRVGRWLARSEMSRHQKMLKVRSDIINARDLTSSGRTTEERNRKRLELMGGLEPPPDPMNREEELVNQRDSLDGRFSDGIRPADHMVRKNRSRRLVTK
ncbi:MAG: hypothetical protein ABH950_05500 [Candidatus Altiarchaeota archaeon]